MPAKQFRPDRERYNPEFRFAWSRMATKVNETSRAKGFWDKERNDGEAIALMHSELSETLEAIREGNPPSRIEGFSQVEEELADVVIRLMDFAAGRGWDIGEAIEAKSQFNETRARMHGKEF